MVHHRKLNFIRAADTALVDPGADHEDEQVKTKIFMFFSSNEFTLLG